MTGLFVVAVVLSIIYAIVFVLWAMASVRYVRELEAHLRNDPPRDIDAVFLMAGLVGLGLLWTYVVSL